MTVKIGLLLCALLVLSGCAKNSVERVGLPVDDECLVAEQALGVKGDCRKEVYNTTKDTVTFIHIAESVDAGRRGLMMLPHVQALIDGKAVDIAYWQPAGELSPGEDCEFYHGDQADPAINWIQSKDDPTLQWDGNRYVWDYPRVSSAPTSQCIFNGTARATATNPPVLIETNPPIKWKNGLS